MESPSRSLILTPLRNRSLRRRRTTADSHSATTSPEFEFWRVTSSLPHFPLHSADELFSDGFLLPLHHLNQPPPDPNQKPDPEEPEQSVSAAITSSAGNPVLSASKRWKEIFKREKKTTSVSSEENNSKSLKKTTSLSAEESNLKSERKKERIRNSGNSSSAELNINLWPFSRSRSAGNNTARSKPASAGRNVSSAPCSRSNSSGESKSSRRSLPSSPGRTGVHIGRSSPVVQLRRTRAVSNNVNGKGRVFNLNVPRCIGYRQENGGAGGAAGSYDGSGSNGNLFSLRGLFSKKGVLTA